MTPSPTAVTLTTTAIRTYKPTDSNDYLLPGIKISKVHNGGSCLSTSIAIGSAGFRCFAADNLVLDPCFPTFVAATEVATCIAAPWDSTVAEMIPSSPLPTLHDTGDSANFPEWIQLANGTRCAAPTGAGDTYQGQRISYDCDHHLYVVGDLGGQGKLKTAALIRADANYNYTWVGIYQVAIIWLPKPDTTEPTTPGESLNGAAIAAYITSQTGDASVQCPQALPVTVGAAYACSGNQVSYTVHILNNTGEYSISYS